MSGPLITELFPDGLKVMLFTLCLTQHQSGNEPIKPLGQCWVPHIVARATEGLFAARELHEKPPTRTPNGYKCSYS